jgi:hypothetical protein
MISTLEKFYQILGKMYNAEDVDLARAIVETPKHEMADFELALATVKPTVHHMTLLNTLYGSGQLTGDWRRAAVAGKIKELEAEK